MVSIPLVDAYPFINLVGQFVRHGGISLPLPSDPVVAGGSPSLVIELTFLATAMRLITFGVSFLLFLSFGVQGTFYFSKPGAECGSFVSVLFVICGDLGWLEVKEG